MLSSAVLRFSRQPELKDGQWFGSGDERDGECINLVDLRSIDMVLKFLGDCPS